MSRRLGRPEQTQAPMLAVARSSRSAVCPTSGVTARTEGLAPVSTGLTARSTAQIAAAFGRGQVPGASARSYQTGPLRLSARFERSPLRLAQSLHRKRLLSPGAVPRRPFVAQMTPFYGWTRSVPLIRVRGRPGTSANAVISHAPLSPVVSLPRMTATYSPGATCCAT